MRTAAGRDIAPKKSWMPFAAATVPIYWGAPDVKQEFKPCGLFVRG